MYLSEKKKNQGWPHDFDLDSWKNGAAIYCVGKTGGRKTRSSILCMVSLSCLLDTQVDVARSLSDVT